jgi:hypothetical protein
MQAGKIIRILSETPIYIAEDENENLVVDKDFFKLGILVNTNRIEEQNIILSNEDKIRVRKMLDRTKLKYLRAPQFFGIFFMGSYVDEIRNTIIDVNIIKHFDEFVALLYPAESFDHYVFTK